MLSKRYLEDKPAERRWISSLDKWLKKVHGYSLLATGPLTPPPRAQRRVRPAVDNDVKNASTKRCSSARPVLIVERIPSPRQKEVELKKPQPVINLNDHFIEVYYCSKTSANNVGHLERYSRVSTNKVCYCCNDCVACKRDRNANVRPSMSTYSRHRPLNQVSRSFAKADVSDKRKCATSLRPYQSFSS